MRLKKVIIVVEAFEKTNKRWLGALRGNTRRTSSSDERLTVASWEILGKVLSPTRLQILSAIPVLKPKSILDLSRSLKRDFKNVHSDVRFLADLGLIELRFQKRTRATVPVAKYDGIEFSLAA